MVYTSLGETASCTCRGERRRGDLREEERGRERLEERSGEERGIEERSGEEMEIDRRKQRRKGKGGEEDL